MPPTTATRKKTSTQSDDNDTVSSKIDKITRWRDIWGSFSMYKTDDDDDDDDNDDIGKWRSNTVPPDNVSRVTYKSYY